MSDHDLFEVLNSETVPGVTLEIVQYKELKGSDDLDAAEKVFFANPPLCFENSENTVLSSNDSCSRYSMVSSVKL